MIFDDEIEYWRLELPYKTSTVNLTVSESYPEDEVKSVAQTALQRVEKNWENIRQNIVNTLLDRYNEEHSGGNPIDSDAFMDCLTIELISIEEDGELELYFDDDNKLFQDKWITLEIAADDSLPIQAELIG